jgi:membrane protease subunit HflC
MVDPPQTMIRRNWRAVLVAGAAAAVVLGSLCIFTVDASQYAVVTEFGKPIQVITDPGLRLKAPYQSVHTFDRRLFTYGRPASEFLTLEKIPVVASSTIIWRIAEPRRFFETVFDRIGAESRLGDILFAELGAALGQSPLASFVTLDPGAYRADAVLVEVSRRCREAALRDYGIAIVDVQLQNLDFPKQNRDRLYARMRSERGRISMRYRAEGEEVGLNTRAVSEEEKARILSRAIETSQRYRGEGEAEAARIYAEALSADPEFYRFLRTMEASRTFIQKGTTMVLPADSELFGLLFDSDYYSHPAAPRSARWNGINTTREGNVQP